MNSRPSSWKAGGVAGAALALACVLAPPPARAQVPSEFELRSRGLESVGQSFDTGSLLITASTGWIAADGQPGVYVGCPQPSRYGFGHNPGMFRYGWYMSPFDVRFSRFWRVPHPAMYGSMYGYWGGYRGFGYGSYWPGTYGVVWDPIPSVLNRCGRDSFYFGYGPGLGFGGRYPISGPGWGIGPWSDLYGYSWGGDPWDYRRNSWYTPGSPRTGALGLNSGADRTRAKTTSEPKSAERVVESRLATGGADLRRANRDLDAAWEAEREPDSEDPLGRSAARSSPTGVSAGSVAPRPEREPVPVRVMQPVKPRAASAAPKPSPGQASRSGGDAGSEAAPSARSFGGNPSNAAPRSRPKATSGSSTRSATPRSQPRSQPRAMPRSTAPRSQPRAAPRSTPRSQPKTGSRSTSPPR